MAVYIQGRRCASPRLGQCDSALDLTQSMLLLTTVQRVH